MIVLGGRQQCTERKNAGPLLELIMSSHDSVVLSPLCWCVLSPLVCAGSTVLVCTKPIGATVLRAELIGVCCVH